MSRKYPGLLFGLFALVACMSIITPQERRQHADTLAAAHGWRELRLPAGKFVLAAYLPESVLKADVLTIYIEGDGLAWLSSSQTSDDPTPLHPVGLELALHHPRGAAVYLARPCQFVEGADARNCSAAYWTGKRFSEEVVHSTDLAVDQLKERFHAQHLQLVGYSGGGAVAALLAARRRDVVLLATVAGNLDHRAWTRLHHVSPLDGSLNPADAWRELTDVPQIHFVGGKDKIVGREVALSYAAHFPDGHRPEIRLIEDFGHTCCWAEKWRELFAPVQ
jgi:dienelactone hydrolase